MEWIQSFIENWGVYAGAIAAAILLFDRIAKITPTNTDNEILKIILKIATVLGIKVEDRE